MWRKLNRIDPSELEKARIQLHNAIQLVSAAPRSYLSNSVARKDWLVWSMEYKGFESISFGNNPKVKLVLDIEQFVLSIFGEDRHIEHLVLSGITYPMAFGWLKIKLDAFALDADQYNDVTNYQIEHILSPDDELYMSNAQVFSDFLTYFSNAHSLLSKLNEGLELDGAIGIDPANLNMKLSMDKSTASFTFGFSMGDAHNKLPYFFIQIDGESQSLKHKNTDYVGRWNDKSWNGLVFSANDFLDAETEVEESLVSNFFNKNYWRLTNK